jgi:hypothetical protein
LILLPNLLLPILLPNLTLLILLAVLLDPLSVLPLTRLVLLMDLIDPLPIRLLSGVILLTDLFHPRSILTLTLTVILPNLALLLTRGIFPLPLLTILLRLRGTLISLLFRRLPLLLISLPARRIIRLGLLIIFLFIATATATLGRGVSSQYPAYRGRPKHR